jgi:hypothetical protein
VLVDIVKSKVCSVCKEEKSLSLFYKRGGKEAGYRSFCKKCKSEKDAKRYNSDKRKNLYLRKHQQEKEARKDYYKINKESYFVRKAQRRAKTLQAIPKWYSSFDDFVLKEAYELCKLRKELLGIDYEVDHIVPLQGKTVCGLHWHKNWAVIPKHENRSKGNRYDNTIAHHRWLYGWI